MAKTLTEIKSLARAHTDSAITVLAAIMTKGDAPEAARVAAANSLLDRGWGKAAQIIAGDEDNPIRHERIVRIIIEDREGLEDTDCPRLPAPN